MLGTGVLVGSGLLVGAGMLVGAGVLVGAGLVVLQAINSRVINIVISQEVVIRFDIKPFLS